jgi:hypothetical protein
VKTSCFFFLAAAALLGATMFLHAAEESMNLPGWVADHRVLRGRLQDPDGVGHKDLDIPGRVGVVIFSVPDMSQGPSQRRWSDLLARDPKDKISDRIGLVLVENMAAAGAFRDDAQDDMKQQFATRKRPFLLLDETGETFKRYGIPRDRTVILIFDQSGTLRDVEENLDDRDATLSRIKTFTTQLMSRS